MNYSFIIPILNEEDNIGRCLESLSLLELPKDDYEVIIVDNGSTDNSISIVNSFTGRINLKTFVLPGINISALRNAGVAHADGNILGFIDADCTVPSDWVDNADNFVRNPEIGAIGCTYTVPEEASWVARAWDMNNEGRRRTGEVEFVPSGGLLVRKDDFLRINGFDEKLATSEDCDFCYRLKGSGKKVWSVPDAAVIHWGVSKNLWHFFNRQRWHGRDVLKVFFQDVRSLNNLKAAIYAMYYILALTGGVLGGILFFLKHSFIFLLLPLGGIIMPPAILSLRTLSDKQKNIGLFLKLWVLYLTYGIARASSIFCGKR